MKNIKVKNKYAGFSIIEVLVSVTLITVGLMAAVNLISSSLVISIDSRNQVIAGGLAQEGVELVRNIRDNNLASGDIGKSFAHIASNVDCLIDKAYTYPANIDCTAGVNAKQLFIDVNGFYVHSSAAGNTATRFYRKLIISGTTDRTVTSMVSWNGVFPVDTSTCNTTNKCAFVSSNLTAWQEN